MPTYADYANSYFGTSSSTPVRLTISRGTELELNSSNGKLEHIEEWVEEDKMDLENIEVQATSFFPQNDIGAGIAPLQDPPTDSSRTFPPNNSTTAFGQRLRNVYPAGTEKRLLIFDTNTFIYSLSFLQSLFSIALARNIGSCRGMCYPAPFAIVVPGVVLMELDTLKTSSRTNVSRDCNLPANSVGSLVRKANRWLLLALQTQNRLLLTDDTTGFPMEPEVAKTCWALHVQTHRERGSFKQPTTINMYEMSADEEIISLCVSLQHDTRFNVYFCTNDTNAAARAEAEMVPTLDYTALLGGQEIDPENAAKQLIEQADAQCQELQDRVYLSTSSNTDADEDMMVTEEANAWHGAASSGTPSSVELPSKEDRSNIVFNDNSISSTDLKYPVPSTPSLPHWNAPDLPASADTSSHNMAIRNKRSNSPSPHDKQADDRSLASSAWAH